MILPNPRNPLGEPKLLTYNHPIYHVELTMTKRVVQGLTGANILACSEPWLALRLEPLRPHLFASAPSFPPHLPRPWQKNVKLYEVMERSRLKRLNVTHDFK